MSDIVLHVCFAKRNASVDCGCTSMQATLRPTYGVEHRATNAESRVRLVVVRPRPGAPGVCKRTRRSRNKSRRVQARKIRKLYSLIFRRRAVCTCACVRVCVCMCIRAGSLPREPRERREEKKEPPPGDRDAAAGKDNTVTDREKEERGMERRRKGKNKERAREHEA